MSDTVHHIAKSYSKGASGLQEKENRQIKEMKAHMRFPFGGVFYSEATALDCVEEAKAASGKDSCPVLKEIAKANLSSADEPLFNALDKCGLAMKFPVLDLQLDPNLYYPCFPPKPQLEAVAKAGFFHTVLGVPVAHAERLLSEFWRKFERIYPSHDIFNQYPPADFEHLLPYYLHGDGGRTFKKDGLMVLSMYNALGRGTNKNPVELQSCKRRRVDSSSSFDQGFQAGVNLRGQSFTNRFLFCAIKHDLYKKNLQGFNLCWISGANFWVNYLMRASLQMKKFGKSLLLVLQETPRF